MKAGIHIDIKLVIFLYQLTWDIEEKPRIQKKSMDYI